MCDFGPTGYLANKPVTARRRLNGEFHLSDGGDVNYPRRTPLLPEQEEYANIFKMMLGACIDV
jgi:hypothetical protein